MNVATEKWIEIVNYVMYIMVIVIICCNLYTQVFVFLYYS